MNQDYYTMISEAVVKGDPERTVELSKQGLSSGFDPMDLIKNGLVIGMNEVGEKFSTGEFFLPDLIIAADCMKKAMAILEPELLARNQVLENSGVVVIGTVKGDIHEIGKSLVGIMLSANGFKVYDLGVDVPVERFVEVAKEVHADIIGLSALLTTTMVVQKDVIARLDEAGLREGIKVMVGGAPVSRSWMEEIGANGYAEDAMGAVSVALELMKN